MKRAALGTEKEDLRAFALWRVAGLTPPGRLLAIGRKMMRAHQGLAFEAFKREFLGQQDIALDKAALRSKTPLLYALAVVTELLDVDRSGVPDEIAGT